MTSRPVGFFRLLGAVLLALLPSWLKVPIYRRCFGYDIGRKVRIGFSLFVGVRRCRIGDRVRIGHGNLFAQIDEIEIGEQTRIGFLNLFRGGDRITLGRYCEILRQNVCNAIVEPDSTEPLHSVLELGTGCMVAAGHWLDFSAGIRIGDGSIIGGRNSSFWTHNRQRGRAIDIGHHCYLGSEIRVAPGTEVAPLCVVSLGAVVIGQLMDSGVLIGGNPAAIVRKLKESEYALVARKTRRDIPDEIANALLPAEYRAAVAKEVARANACG